METPVNAPLKEKFRLEIAKLREMSFKEKLDHIWEYYKFFIIGLVIFLIILGSLINAWFINPQPQTALFISWNSGFAMDVQLTELSNKLTERLVEETANETVVVSMMLTDTNDPTLNMASTQRLVAMLAAGEIDVFILDSMQLDEFASTGFIRPMENLLAEIRLTDSVIYSEIEERVAYARHELEEGVFAERLMGVSIMSSPLLIGLDFLDQDLYFSVSATSNRHENVAAALIAFFE